MNVLRGRRAPPPQVVSAVPAGLSENSRQIQDADDNYGRFTASGATVGAWRFLRTAHHGPLPPRVVVMHQSCNQPSCTRLDHLRAGGQSEDLASAAGRDRCCGWRLTGRADRRADGRTVPGHPVRPDRPARTRDGCRQRWTLVTLGRTGQCCSDRVGRGPQLVVPTPPARG